MRGCGTYKLNRDGEDKTVPTFLNNATRFTVMFADWIQIGMPTSEIILFEWGLLRNCYFFSHSNFA